MFTLKGQAPSLGDMSSAQAQTDTEASLHEDMEFLVSIRRQLICKASRGATKVYTTEDSSFQIDDVVILQDENGHTEAHRVKGHGSLILDSPLEREYGAGSEIRTMVGSERVYQKGQYFYVGYDQGRQMVAELIQPDSRVPGVPTFGGSPLGPPEESSGSQRNPDQPGESSGSRRTPEQQEPERSSVPESVPPGRQAPATSGLGEAEANGQYDRHDNGSSFPGQGRQEPARSTSPQAIAQDEKIFARYFTRGSQGVGEVERAN
eukprot:243918-Amphidinium_carterae.1